MTPEEQKEYWISDDDIVERFEAEDIGTTDDEASAIYVLRNGTMIDGGFQSGCRGEDHACVEHILPGASRYSGDFWEEVFARTEMVMLVPETKMAVYPEWLTPTTDQQAVIDDLGYETSQDY